MQNHPLSRHAYWQACCCLGLSMALVGCYVALAKPLVSVFGVFALAWMRFVIGALAVPHWLRKPAQEPALTPRLKGLLFLESFLGNFLFSICMLYGVSQTSALAAGIILSMLPIVVAVLSAPARAMMLGSSSSRKKRVEVSADVSSSGTWTRRRGGASSGSAARRMKSSGPARSRSAA